MQVSSAYGMLGNIDANTGDAQVGWDTDQASRPASWTLIPVSLLPEGVVQALPHSPGTLTDDQMVQSDDAAMACSWHPPVL